MLFIVETEKQQYFKEVLDHLEIDFLKRPLSLNILGEYIMRVHVKIML